MYRTAGGTSIILGVGHARTMAALPLYKAEALCAEAQAVYHLDTARHLYLLRGVRILAVWRRIYQSGCGAYQHLPVAADCHHGLVVAARKARAVPTGHHALFGHLPGGADDYLVPYHLYARQADGAAVSTHPAANCYLAVVLLYLVGQ